MSRKCKTKYCRRKARKGGKDCNTCHSRKVRANNPIRAAYRAKKSDAKKRGKHFDISLDYFAELVLSSGYIEGKGRTKESLHLHRIIEEKGYVEGNIKVVTNEQNRAAYVEYLKNKKSLEEDDIITGDLSEVTF